MSILAPAVKISARMLPLTAALLFAAPQPLLAVGQGGAVTNNPAGRQGDPLMMVESEDPAMNAAIAQAQATLPEWLALLADPPAGSHNFAVKFPLEGVEHIWVGGVHREGDVLVGTLSNVPYLPGWKQGQEVRVPLGDVSDWAYWDAANKAHGYRTVAVMLPRMNPAQAKAIRAQFGWSE